MEISALSPSGGSSCDAHNAYVHRCAARGWVNAGGFWSDATAWIFGRGRSGGIANLLRSCHYWAGALLSEITFLFTISNPFHPRKMCLQVFAPAKPRLGVAGSWDYSVHQLSQLIYHASVCAAVWFNRLIKTVLIDVYSLAPSCSDFTKSFSWVRRRQRINPHFSICLLKKKWGPEKARRLCLYLSAENQPQTYALLLWLNGNWAES